VGAYQAEAWADFGVAVAGAGAALAGLVFVALSINLERILAGYRLTARAGHTLMLLAAPLVIALLLLIPGQSESALGTELVVLGAVTGAWLAVLNRPWLRSPEQPLLSWITNSAIPAGLLSVATVVGGLGTITGTLGGLYWLPAGVIAAFVGALLNAWVLLVEILR
jgi:modulator of FtsH protease